MAKKCYECLQGAQTSDYDDDIRTCRIVDPKTNTTIKVVKLCGAHRFDGWFVWESYIIEEVEEPVEHTSNILMTSPVTENPGTREWFAQLDALVRFWTGWDSLREMCANNPTLRVSKHSTIPEQEAILAMRAAYKFVNGRDAYPPNGA